jgi:hypothetical protein
VFAAKIVLSTANHHLPLNSGVCSELPFAAKIVFFVANQSLLLKLGCVKRSSVRCRNCVAYSESMFAIETVMSITSQCSLLKLCYQK